MPGGAGEIELHASEFQVSFMRIASPDRIAPVSDGGAWR
jgi:hypothetical protein